MGITDDIPVTWNRYLKGAAQAGIGGAFAALAVLWAVPDAINFTSEGLAVLGKVMLVGAISSVRSYFKEAPRVPWTMAERVEKLDK